MPTRPRPSAIKGSDELKTDQIVIYQDKHRRASLEVRLEEETVWLSQAQMADLFAKDIRTVSEHIQNIYAEGELKRRPTIRKFRIVQIEGKRKVERDIDLYNLDVVILVGYRVKSQRGTQFRIWATGVLRDHIIKGVTVNQNRIQELKGKQLDEFREVLALLESAKQKALTKDETAGLLEVRPGFVRKESRTRGQVFGCLLALKISREMKRRLQAVFGTTDADPHAITLADATTALSRLCLLEYQIDDKTTVTRLPKPDARQKQILEALQVHLPQK